MSVEAHQTAYVFTVETLQCAASLRSPHPWSPVCLTFFPSSLFGTRVKSVFSMTFNKLQLVTLVATEILLRSEESGSTKIEVSKRFKEPVGLPWVTPPWVTVLERCIHPCCRCQSNYGSVMTDRYSHEFTLFQKNPRFVLISPVPVQCISTYTLATVSILALSITEIYNKNIFVMEYIKYIIHVNILICKYK